MAVFGSRPFRNRSRSDLSRVIERIGRRTGTSLGPADEESVYSPSTRLRKSRSAVSQIGISRKAAVSRLCNTPAWGANREDIIMRAASRDRDAARMSAFRKSAKRCGFKLQVRKGLYQLVDRATGKV